MKNLTPAKMVMFLFVAIALLIGGFVVKKLMATEEPVTRIGTQLVPLPTGDLSAGTVITENHIGLGKWVSDELDGDVLLSASVIIGRVVKNDIKGAELIRGRDLYSPGELPKLPLSTGTRGVTIKIKEPALMMEGWLKPGSHVDVLFTLDDMMDDPRVRKLGGMSMTLFKGVRILAINRDIVQAPLEDSANSVTLEIDENDVNILRLATKKGEIALALTQESSGLATVSVSNPDRATLEEMLNLEPIPEPPAPTPAPQPFVSHIYRRSGHSSYRFGANGVPVGGSGLNNSGNDPGPGANGLWNGRPVNTNTAPNGYNNGVNGYNNGVPAGTNSAIPGFQSNIQSNVPGISARERTTR